MSYSLSTIAAFSAALGRVHQTPEEMPRASTGLPQGHSSVADLAFLDELLESQRQQASQPRPPTAPPASSNERVALFGRLRDRGLTARECEVLGWIAQGKRDAEIAAILGCTPKTVSKHVEHLLAKLGAENRLAAASTAGDFLRTENSEPTSSDVSLR